MKLFTLSFFLAASWQFAVWESSHTQCTWVRLLYPIFRPAVRAELSAAAAGTVLLKVWKDHPFTLYNASKAKAFPWPRGGEITCDSALPTVYHYFIRPVLLSEFWYLIYPAASDRKAPQCIEEAFQSQQERNGASSSTSASSHWTDRVSQGTGNWNIIP